MRIMCLLANPQKTILTSDGKQHQKDNMETGLSIKLITISYENITISLFTEYQFNFASSDI